MSQSFRLSNGKRLTLLSIRKSNPVLQGYMRKHYSRPRGFVGRQLFYQIFVDGVSYGAIVAGSATAWLPGRDEFFGSVFPLNNLVNNIFYHVEKINGEYPIYNFTSIVVEAWRRTVITDWPKQYKSDAVLGWESLVELPRTGELYVKDGWTNVGKTKGYTCKRKGGFGTDSWTGRRVWNTEELRPKHVFVRRVIADNEGCVTL